MRSYKTVKASSYGYHLTEEELRLLYYIWAVAPSGSYYDYMSDGTCYATGQFLLLGIDLAAIGLFDIDPKDMRSVRLTTKGYDLVLQL